MAKLGICADPGHDSITAQDVIDSGAQIASLVLKKADADQRIAFADQLHREGIDVLGLMVYGESTSDFDSVKEAAHWYHQQFGGTISILQIANEPDLEATWMEPTDLLVYVYDVLAGWGPRFGIPIWLAGFASGDPSYIDVVKDELLRVVDAVTIHPYGQGADENHPGPFGLVENLVAAYDFGVPITASEWGIARRDADSDSERAEYITAMILKLRELDVDSCLFCLGPMVDEFDIRGPEGEPTEMLAAFVGSFS